MRWDVHNPTSARGERVGRAVLLPDDVADLIHDMRSEGMTYAAIAAELADEGIPTATGRGPRPVTRRADARPAYPVAARGICLAGGCPARPIPLAGAGQTLDGSAMAGIERVAHPDRR